MAKKGDLSDIKDFLKAKGMTTSQLSTPGDGPELEIFLKKQNQGLERKTSSHAIAVPEHPAMDEDDPDDDAEGEPADINGHEYVTKLDRQAEELSQVGKMATKKVSQRLQDMLKVCNAMKSHMECEVIGKNIKKAETAEMLKIQSGLNDVCCDLKKQMLSKTTVNMEKAKTSLQAGAKAIREGKAFVRKI
jgi:hypothetical protein